MDRIILGGLLIVVGYILVWKADWFLRNFGSIPSAEKFLKTEGGTRLFYKLIGVLMILIGGLHIPNLLTPLGAWIVKSLFNIG